VNRTTGRSAFLSLLKAEGITHLFGNPGTTELPIMHALSDHPEINYIMAMQESLVVAMADGYSRASGKLCAVNLHVAPGLGNAMGALFAAKFSGSPIIISAGQQEQGHGLTEPLLYDPLVPIAQPLVKWAVEVTRLEDLPRIMHRAAKIAMTPPTGPVFMSLPGDILNMEGGLELGSPTRVEAAGRPSDDTIERMIERILAAKSPVVISGDEVPEGDALKEVAELARLLGAPAYGQTVPSSAHYLSEEPTYMGGLSRNQRQVREILSKHDLMICVGADVLRMSVWDEIEPLPDGMPILQIGQRDWEMGKNYPTEMAIRADVKETLKVLNPCLAERGGANLQRAALSGLAGIADTNWSAKRVNLVEKIGDAAGDKPIDADWLMMQVVDTLPKDVIVVEEGITTSRMLNALMPVRGPNDLYGLASGGIGWGIPAAVGIQMAHPDRRVLAIIGDGSAMYSIQALWTAAHHKLPITYLISNNGGYRIIKERLKSFHGNENFVGMNFQDPSVDYTALARSLGMTAERVEDPGDVQRALQASYEREGPTLLEVMTKRGIG
jgi:benzoylformate decarboxylase